MRLAFALLISLGICIGIFFGMHLMTKSDGKKIEDSSQTRQLIYLREKKDTNIERKKRVKPKEPLKKEPPKKIKIKTNLDTKINENVKIKPLKVQTQKIDVSSISSLSGAQIAVGSGLLDARSLQRVKDPRPRYPRRAKVRKQEGSVDLVFSIDTEGLVSNVKVVNSTPKGVFDKAAISAIKKWRFKRLKNPQNASITFNFRLAQ